MHPSKTVAHSSRTTLGEVLAITLFALLMQACSPGAIANEGGETGSVEEIPSSSGAVFCVEELPGQTTCWTDWGASFARVMLDCQIADAVSLGWSAAYDDVLPLWGLVSCHDTAGLDVRVCFYGSANVMLSEVAEGLWEAAASSTVGTELHVEAPCGESPCEFDAAARRSFAGIECATECTGLWECSEERSRVFHTSDFDGMAAAEVPSDWGCEPTPDVDACYVIDAQAHVACVRYYGTEWAYIVAPTCLVAEPASWISVGLRMSSALV